MKLGHRPRFSIIVPTRGRPDYLQRLLKSFEATTASLDLVELILIIDSDDRKSIEFTYENVLIKRVVIQPGASMGALNMAGYQAATGDYLMLLNDDVILRTQGWDERVWGAFKMFSDGIVLVHVNDKIFGKTLCTFPFVTRKYCEIAGGICPTDYVRYRIDDHIYNVFNLLAVLGKVRITYLPDVVFEHTNSVLTLSGVAEYKPDEGIHEIDTRLFNELLAERKQLALRLVEQIEREANRDNLRNREKLLDPIVDSVALRRPEYVRVCSDGNSLSSDNARVTIGIVSADLGSDHARTCIDLVKKFTRNFELIILDNNRRSTFNHPREMNKLLSICDTDYLVLMDDDVFVEPGWLDGILRCMAPTVGVVTPLHKDVSGALSYAGVVMRPDYTGHHSHNLAMPHGPARIQTLCSAIMLIDMAKCGGIRFDEAYSKYFLDIDYGLRVWSSDCEVVCSPYTMVTHIGGGTLKQGGTLSNDLFETHRQHFVQEWINTGRYQRLEEGVWRTIPEIQCILNVAGQVDALINEPKRDREQFRLRARDLFTSFKDCPALANWASERIWHAVGQRRPHVDDPDCGHLGFLLGCTPFPMLIEQNFEGLNIVLYDANYYAISRSDGPFDYDKVVKGSYSQCYQAETIEVLKARIRAGVSDVSAARRKSERSTGGVQSLWRTSHELWQRFENDRAWFGSWRAALQSVGKDFLKARIIAIFGIRGFLKVKDIYWKAKEQKVKHGGTFLGFWFGVKLIFQEGIRTTLSRGTYRRLGGTPIDSKIGQTRVPSQEGPDPQRWLKASPATLVEKDYRGYSIYRFEYRFFASQYGIESLWHDVSERGDYNPHLIGHSLNEIHSAVDHFLKIQEADSSPHPLVLACLPPSQLRPLLQKIYPPGTATLLVSESQSKSWTDYGLISMDQGSVFEWARSLGPHDSPSQQVLSERFDRVTIPWHFPETWGDNALEIAATKLSKYVEILPTSGSVRTYHGENLHRLVYNKAYLASMFQVVPSPRGKTILEAGCSDGLVCHMLAQTGAEKVFGIDVMKTVGCGFPHDRIAYQVMDIARMSFTDQTFDIVYSIATFEHLANPYKGLLEMLRVIKVGGCGYIQAGPLYHSPFGHHMFQYFNDFPWIHLRKSKDAIVSYSKERGIDRQIEHDLAMTCEQYVEGMLHRDHVNGLLLKDYGLEEFRERPDIEILKYNISYEGSELLTPEIVAEIHGLDADRLVEHGFEIAFRRIS